MAIVRSIAKGDCSAIVSLRDELALFTNQDPNVSLISANQLETDAFADPPQFQCIVAVTKSEGERSTDTIVGYATYVIGYPIWKGKEIALQEIYVTKVWRGSGLGKQLLQELAKVAIDGNYARISVDCLSGTPAASFFRNLHGIDMTLAEEWHTLRIKKESFHKIAS